MGLREEVLKGYDEAFHDQKIPGFFKEHRFLSNFEPSEIEYRGVKFPTAEHAYQAMKVENEHFWRYMASDPDPFLASDPDPFLSKKIGGTCVMRNDWDSIRDKVMYEVNVLKYQIPALRAKLIKTGKAELIEVNWWKDVHFGVCNGKGDNILGKILMRVRQEIGYTPDITIDMGTKP